MSDKKKWPIDEAWSVALELTELFAAHAERICIAGSIRRRKPLVGDIELLAIPKMGVRQADMFTTESFDTLHEFVGFLIAAGILAKRPNVNGAFTYGLQNKLLIHCASGIPVDLFSTTLEKWWVSLVVRTGSKETNLRLTIGAQALGRKLYAYGAGVTMPDGRLVLATSEQEVFQLCNAKYLDPENR